MCLATSTSFRNTDRRSGWSAGDATQCEAAPEDVGIPRDRFRYLGSRERGNLHTVQGTKYETVGLRPMYDPTSLGQAEPAHPAARAFRLLVRLLIETVGLILASQSIIRAC